MKTNRKSIVATGIVTAMLALSGCGGGDSGSAQSGSNNGSVGGQTGNQPNTGPIVNNEFKFTTFDLYTDVVNGQYKEGWGKLKFTWSPAAIKEEISTVVGVTPYEEINKNYESDNDYYVGNNLFLAVPDTDFNTYSKVSIIDNDTLKITIRKDKSSLSSDYDIISYDLAGLGKTDPNATTGLYTDLRYDYFPNNVAFPKGSVCYMLQETPNDSYYYFYEKGDSSQMTIDSWLNKQAKTTYYKDGKTYTPKMTTVIKEKVGLNNSLQAVRFKDQFGIYHAAVQFNGELYEAQYNEKGVKEALDLDPKTSLIECTAYNNTAANYLEQQIKANYK